MEKGKKTEGPGFAACYHWMTPCRKDALAKWSSRDQEGTVCDVRWGMLVVHEPKDGKLKRRFVCISFVNPLCPVQG